jgi:Domain of unknown function (DUF3330)
MPTSDKSAEPALVSCEVCLKEVPITEATIPEATDYVVHFCGLECYEKWKSQGKTPGESLGKAPS